MTEEIYGLEFTFNYEHDDFKKSMLSILFSKERIILSLILSTIVFGLAILYVIVNDLALSVDFEDALFLILILGFILIMNLRSLIAVRQLKLKWFTSQKYNRDEYKVTINDAGIFFSSISGNLNCYWGYVYKVIEQKEAFCVYMNSHEYKLIPKRVLDVEQIQNLRKIFFMKIGLLYSIQGFNKKKILEDKLL